MASKPSYRDDNRTLQLLNSHNEQLKKTCCQDCGMDLQDVPHLLKCTAHPNNLSPVDLWDKPIKTIKLYGPEQPGITDEDG